MSFRAIHVRGYDKLRLVLSPIYLANFFLKPSFYCIFSIPFFCVLNSIARNKPPMSVQHTQKIADILRKKTLDKSHSTFAVFRLVSFKNACSEIAFAVILSLASTVKHLEIKSLASSLKCFGYMTLPAQILCNRSIMQELQELLPS